MSKHGYVYMMTDKCGKLFVGATIDLPKRVRLHKHALYTPSRKKKQLIQLVYVEKCVSVVEALVRKAELAASKREKKLSLIARQNPLCNDLCEIWCGEEGTMF